MIVRSFYKLFVLSVLFCFVACSEDEKMSGSPQILVSGDIAFGEIAVGQSIVKSFSIQNTGDAELVIYQIKSPTEFRCLPPDTIKQGTTKTVEVLFNPLTIGSYTGKIEVLSNADDSTNIISVSGSSIQLPSSNNWSAEVGNPVIIPNNTGLENYKFFPDGHISVIENGSTYLMFWAASSSRRSESNSQYPEDHKKFSPVTPVVGGKYNDVYPINTWDTTNFDNGGVWLYSVFRKSGGQLIGFAHLEYHWPMYVYAYKSIGVISSTDNGRSWTKPVQIITKKGKIPNVPSWSGLGDFCVVWDAKNNRWMCFYQNAYICTAMSEDIDGKPGTWKKYYMNSFSQPGIQGMESPITNLHTVKGGNPSVHFNRYLNKWIMVYHSWTGSIYISSSHDLLNWDSPRLLIPSAHKGGLAWYPTIIGIDSRNAGQTAKIYYSDRVSANTNERDFIYRTITFNRVD